MESKKEVPGNNFPGVVQLCKGLLFFIEFKISLDYFSFG
jgi:hypothetical protein